MSSPDGEALDPAAARLGAYVRTLRKSRGMTLVQLAAATDLSHPFLSQCERGRASFSLASLRRIAVALGTSPVELIAAAEAPDGDAAPPFEVHRSSERGGVTAGFAAGDARVLAKGRRPFMPLEFVGTNREPAEYFTHAEDEFVYVVEGSVSVDCGGAVTVLEPGDSMYYVGGMPHRWWCSDGEFRLVVVKQPPLA